MMKQQWKRSLILITIAHVMTVCSSLNALVITGFIPDIAVPGQTVDILVEGIDPTATYTVQIGGLESSVLETTDSLLRVQLPQNAITGLIKILEQPDGDSLITELPYRVMAQVSIELHPDIPNASSGFSAASFFEIVSLGNGNPMVSILNGIASPLVAVHETGQPVLMAIANVQSH